MPREADAIKIARLDEKLKAIDEKLSNVLKHIEVVQELSIMLDYNNREYKKLENKICEIEKRVTPLEKLKVQALAIGGAAALLFSLIKPYLLKLAGY